MVEGKDDKLFFEALLKYLKLSDIQVMPIGGKTLLRRNLKALATSPKFGNVVSLGIVRDADDDPKSAFQSVCDALKHATLRFPERPLAITDNKPRISVMVLPDGKTKGSLETICLDAIGEDSAIPCVKQYFECLKRKSLPAHKRSKVDKAKVQAFLASRPEPGKRLGEAAQAGYWPLDHDAFKQIKIFLKKLAE